MKKIAILGAGKIGAAVAQLLSASGDYAVTLVDKNPASLQSLSNIAAKSKIADLAKPAEIQTALTGQDYCLSTSPFFLNTAIANVAHGMGVHYFDVTEDVATTRAIKELAKTARSALVPQCGLAPGYISIAAHSLSKNFDTLYDITMRVGALPQYPTNSLKYNLTWSTDGLINEYCNPCEAIIGGKLTELPPLEGVEHFRLDGAEYEAFNTSGGLGSLHETLDGRAMNVAYKTIRYPGHRDIMHTLLHDLRLAERRDVLKNILEHSIPTTKQDVVLIFITVTGLRDGRYLQENFLRRIHARELFDETWSAIELTTASSVCAMIDLHRTGALPQTGFVRQEDITLDIYTKNRFGQYYD